MRKHHYFRVLALFLMSFLSFQSFSAVKKSDCLHKRNTICHSIIKLNSKLDHKEAYKLSNIFSKVSRAFKLDSKLLISIAYQESTFNPKAIRKVSGLVFDAQTNSYKKMKVGSDFCMMQIHVSNIKKMELDVAKLLSEPTYCIEAGAKILARYKNEFGKQKNWWTLYNAKSKAKRAIYLDKVTRHLNILHNKTKKSRNIASKK